MFGHQEPEQDNNLPQPDGALAHNDQGLTTSQMDDIAGDFIEDPPSGSTPPSAPPPLAQPTTSDDTNDANDTAGTTSALTVTDTPTPTTDLDTDKLLDIKQQALQQLTPLVGHLEQTPEEKFRTTMMMIQAADNHELIQAAYEAAQQITDEKARAQALLDIVNEINYFTHNSGGAA